MVRALCVALVRAMMSGEDLEQYRLLERALAQAKADTESWHASLADTINTGIREVGSVNSQIKAWDIESLRAGINEIVYASNRRLAQAQGEIKRLKLVIETRGSLHDVNLCTHYLEAERLKKQLAATSQDILRAQVERVALDELVSAVEDARRRHDAGDGLALESNMLRATLRQAKKALTEPGGQPHE